MLFAAGFLMSITISHISSLELSLSVIPANQPVKIGQEVILTCQVKGVRSTEKYSVLFKLQKKGISEKCQAYNEQKYHVVCEPNDWRNATTYKLYIKSVDWTDRGSWSCIYAAHIEKINLDVYAPAKLKKMGVSNLHETDQRNMPSIISGTAAGPPSSGSAPRQHVGLGTRTSPFDLRSGIGLQLICETECGYPRANISWSLVNGSMQRPSPRSSTYPNDVRSNACAGDKSTQDMTTTRSGIQVTCNQLGLVGLTEIWCSISGAQYGRDTPIKHVYVLCPGNERQLDLTSGEKVGIAVGCALALILLFIGCIIVHGHNKQSPIPISSYVTGQRV